MKLLNFIFSFYINSSIHVSLAVVSLTVVTDISFEVFPDSDLLFFIFFATVTGYNFVKYSGVAKLHHLSLAKNLRLIQIFSFLAFAGLVYFTFQQSISVLLIAALLGLFTLLYALPVFGNSQNLRALAGVKIFVTALVWAGVTVLLPLVDHVYLLQWDVLNTFFQRFFFVIAITLPFEIRDLKFDNTKLKTIPQLFGVRGAQKTGFGLIFLFVLLEFLKENTSSANMLSVIAVAIVSVVLLHFSSREQPRYYASFLVEGISIIWMCFLLLGKVI